jgi:YHS domain-containing protein
MKIILHNNGNIIDTIEGVDGVSTNDNNIYWDTGSMLGISSDFIILNDTDELTDDKILEYKRQLKLSELNDACNNAILERFPFEIDGVTYYFSHDTEAQDNFERLDKAFEKGRTTSELWTAYDSNGNVVRLSFDIVSFEPLYIEHLKRITDNISRFRDILMPQVLNAATIEDVQSITW